MTENILVGVAWPFPNGSLHLGQIVGAYLPADIFARYQRLAGNRVIMVSGSDQNGTPIVMLAEARGVRPEDIVSMYHNEYLDCWSRLGISWDCYTSTGTQNHIETAQEIFTKLFEKGDLYLETMEQTYCVAEGRFLPDRYVEGTCPFCGFDGARGDQCDNCGRSLDPVDLINPRCRHDGSTPERRPTEHFFLRLSAYNDQVKEWLSTGKEHWRRSVTSFSMGVLNEGLKDRAITRDLEWGVPIPLPGYDTKRIYVWFENVVGYLSAAKEWAQKAGTPDAWKDFWLDPASKIYYFIGKDNIWFHTLSWPAMVMMYDGGLNQPYDVPANQYLNFGGWKASTSRGTAPFLPEYLERYDADAIRFYLAAVMPESSDSEFSEDDLVRRNNEELVSTWGNLVNRVLTMTYRNFDGKVPDPGELTLGDNELLEQGQAVLASVGESLNACRFREALRSALSYAQDTNRYLNQEEPWQTMKTDKQAAARALYTALGAIEVLKVAFDPFVPFSSQKLNELLGHTGAMEDQGWTAGRPVIGTELMQPEALFKKLELPATPEAAAP